jgi:type I restriction enzyme R subunit
MYEASNEENLPVRVVKPETELRSKRNLVQTREFSEMLKKTRNAYHNRAIATQEVIEEFIKLAKEMSAANQRGVDLGLTMTKSRSTTPWRQTTAR